MAVRRRGAGVGGDGRPSGRARGDREPAGPQEASQDRPGRRRHQRDLLVQGRLPTCWIRRPRSWRRGPCWAATTTCAAITRPGCSGSMRCCSTRAPRHARSCRRRPGGPNWPRSRGSSCRRRGGQVAAAVLMLAATEAQMEILHRHLLATGRRMRGPRGSPTGCTGRPDHRPGVDLLAGRGRPVHLRPQGGPVRRPGHHRVLLGRQTLPWATVPAGTGGAAVVPIRGGQDPRPPVRARPCLLCGGQAADRCQRAALSQARCMVVRPSTS